jgi:hypothetical protein
VTEQPRDIMFDPQRRKAEMQKLQQMGVKGIKVDFFQSDKQPVIGEYFDILKDAADHQIMVNFHGCTIPRGWSRTWPNLVSMESVRGAESLHFCRRLPRRHAAAQRHPALYPQRDRPDGLHAGHVLQPEVPAPDHLRLRTGPAGGV